MKILMINKFYYLRGGSERCVFELSKLLENNGHQVIPFSTLDKKNVKSKFDQYFIKKINLEKFNLINILKIFYNWDAVKKLEQLIKDEKPDIAHLHNIAHHLSPAIIKVLKKHNIPVIQTLHDYKLICPNYKLFSKNEICFKCQNGKYYNCFLRKCVKNSLMKSFLAMMEAYLNNKILKLYDKIDLFIAPSRFMKDICVKFGLQESKIKIIYNFIDVDAQANKWVGDHKNLADKKEESKYILYFGRLSQEKGVADLIKAYAKIHQIMGHQLVIAGDGEERKNLEQLAQNLNISSKVKFVNHQHSDELLNLISNSTFVVVPSIWQENAPYSVIEAMVLAKTVICSKIGGLSELIEDKKNGFLYPPGDVDKLADIMEKMLMPIHEQLLQKIGQLSRKKIIIKNNKESYYRLLITIYEQTIKQAKTDLG
ncbi:MAG: glycosyltransferase family 4 protein [Patescibacteria group bacterium]